MRKTPVLFLGHGSPLNALADNPFTRSLAALGAAIAKPEAVLCVSAHWMTEGTWVTHMAQPRTIHDFSGFPEALARFQYAAPGAVARAEDIAHALDDVPVGLDDDEWGLDHGTWSVLCHLFPEADIPVLQMSLDLSKPAGFHFDLGARLRGFREQGLLIIGSGNIVHNLRRIDWEENAKTYDWAREYDAWVKDRLRQRDFAGLIRDHRKSEAGRLSVPTPEHFYPLLYVLGAAEPEDELQFVFEGFQNASISMRSLKFSSLNS